MPGTNIPKQVAHFEPKYPVDTLTLTPQEASTKLNQLIASNFHFRNNRKLVIEIEKRLKLWK